MTKAHLTAGVLVLLFVRWLATVSVPLPVAGGIITVPALAVAAVTATVVAAALVALIVYRTRAERAMVAAWQAHRAAAR